jgi:predicted RNase H-like nuclease (RuvC/YqgF family)
MSGPNDVVQDVGRLEGKVTMLLETMRQIQSTLADTQRVLSHIDLKVSQIESLKSEIDNVKRKLSQMEVDVESLQGWRNRIIGFGAAAGALAGFSVDKIMKIVMGN